MDERTCSVDGCGRPIRAKMMCWSHYQKRWRDARTDPCSVDDCSQPQRCKGYCTTHYRRWRAHGDPNKVVTRAIGVCSYEPCDRPHYGKGLCQPHWERQSRGSKLGPIREHRPSTERDEQGRKSCRRCREWLPEGDFAKSSKRADGLQGDCRKCVSDKGRLAKYGITPERYRSILETQGGGCAICGGEDPTGRALAVDHDHSCCPEDGRSCGRCIRGILCSPCNQAVGLLADSLDRIEAAAAYLRRHAA